MASFRPPVVNAETQSRPSTKVSDLPDQVIVRILANLPVKDMYQCRVSRRWYDLVSLLPLWEIDLIPYADELDRNTSALKIILSSWSGDSITSLKLSPETLLDFSQVFQVTETLTQLTVGRAAISDLLKFKNLACLKVLMLNELCTHDPTLFSETDYRFLCGLNSLHIGQVKVDNLEYVLSLGDIPGLHSVGIYELWDGENQFFESLFRSCPNLAAISCDLSGTFGLAEELGKKRVPFLKSLEANISILTSSYSRAFVGYCDNLKTLILNYRMTRLFFKCNFESFKCLNVLENFKVTGFPGFTIEELEKIALEARIVRLDISGTGAAIDPRCIDFIIKRGYDLRCVGLAHNPGAASKTGATLTVNDIEKLVRNCPRLESLDISHQVIDDVIFSIIQSAEKLRYLWLAGTKCTRDGFERFLRDRAKLIPLQTFTPPVLHVSFKDDAVSECECNDIDASLLHQARVKTFVESIKPKKWSSRWLISMADE